MDLMERSGMFDSTLFDNSNWRKVVRRPSKVGMFNQDLVWLIQLKDLNKKSEQNIIWTKSEPQLCLITINFDKFES
jgi:hypothetical protein